MKKSEYIRRSLTKISRKSWEYFIVSRVLHRLDDLEIEFITQQLVRLADGRRALTDLYFPQFNLHLEVDEPFHKNNHIADNLRQRDIVAVTEHDIVRITVSDDTDIDVICSETEAFINKLKGLKRDQVAADIFQPWNFEDRYLSGPVIARGYLDIDDKVAFRRQDEAMRCFGFTGKGWQKGGWVIPDGSTDWLWFPRLYPHDDRWSNEMSADGQTISQRGLTEEAKATNMRALEKERARTKDRSVIVFAKAQDSLGASLLRYVGTFRMDRETSSSEALIFRRIAAREKTRCKRCSDPAFLLNP